jgi:RNA polymerase sigma factor (sigma-70 family)
MDVEGGKGMRLGSGRWANVEVAEVVRMAAEGHKEGWDELHRRYHKMIARIARSSGCPSADLSDVQQAVWARLVQHIGRLQQPEAVAGWLAVVTKRECIRMAGKQGPILHVVEDEPAASTDEEPLVTVLDAERRATVRRAVATLPPRRRKLMETMLDHPDLGYDQLSTRLSMPRGSIGPTRQRCLDDLRQRRDLIALRSYPQPA